MLCPLWLRLEPVSHRYLAFTHGPHRYNLSESGRAQGRVNRGEASMIENIVGREAEFQALHLFHLNSLSKGHIHINRARANNDVSSSIAERSRWVGEGSGVEPVQNVGIAGLNGLSGDDIRPMRACDSATDIGGVAKNARRKRKT